LCPQVKAEHLERLKDQTSVELRKFSKVKVEAVTFAVNEAITIPVRGVHPIAQALRHDCA
jgi:hypothetical protein